jgi:hypothetical protein
MYGYVIRKFDDGLMLATYDEDEYVELAKKARAKHKAKVRKEVKLKVAKEQREVAESLLKQTHPKADAHFTAYNSMLKTMVSTISCEFPAGCSFELKEGMQVTPGGGFFIHMGEVMGRSCWPHEYNVCGAEYYIDSVKDYVRGIPCALRLFMNSEVHRFMRVECTSRANDIPIVAHAEVFADVYYNLEKMVSGGPEVSNAVFDEWLSRHSLNRVTAQRKVDREKFHTLLSTGLAPALLLAFQSLEAFLRWWNSDEFERKLSENERKKLVGESQEEEGDE